MRLSRFIRVALGLQQTRVLEVRFESRGVLVAVAPRWRRARCGRCGRRAPVREKGFREQRRWRHLDLGGWKTWLLASLRRVACRRCGIRVEAVPWARVERRFTPAFESAVVHLAQHTDLDTVRRHFRITWRSAQRIVHRAVRAALDPRRFEGVRVLGIDEISYKRRHHYVTTVTDLERGVVLWSGEGKDEAALERFFAEFGEGRARSIEAVCIDMSSAYEAVVRRRAPQAEIVYDRFHVVQLLLRAVDNVRRQEWRAAGEEERSIVKGTRYLLTRRPENLPPDQRLRLRDLERENRRLFRAWLLKEYFQEFWEHTHEGGALRHLVEWVEWARRSRLAPMRKFARTVVERMEGLLAYIRRRITNGLVEGLHNKIRLLSHRAFGLHSAEALIDRIYLTCSGLSLRT